MCRGPIKCEDHSAIRMCVFKDFSRDLDLIGELGEIPLHIKAFSRVSNLSGFKRGKTLLVL